MCSAHSGVDECLHDASREEKENSCQALSVRVKSDLSSQTNGVQRRASELWSEQECVSTHAHQSKREQHVAVSTRCMTMATEAHVGMPIEYRPVLTGALLAPNAAALAEPQAWPESAKGASGVRRRGE